MAFYREIPKNEPVKLTWLVGESRIGEILQKYVDDPSVVFFDAKPRPIGGGWIVNVKFAVLDLEQQQAIIAERLKTLSEGCIPLVPQAD